MELSILAVSVSPVRIIGSLHGEPVLSGIDKRPATAARVFVGPLGIEGDAQADLTVHGGVDKAVYVYPSEHWPWWSGENDLACRPATFGENLTLAGADETEVAIGDRFRWGDAILEVSQPRAPCYKLALHTARPDVPSLMTRSARCGWYLRVVEPGAAPISDSRLSRMSQSGGPSVDQAFRLMFERLSDPSQRRAVASAPALAEAWRSGLKHKT